MEDESFPALEQNPDRSFSPASIDNLLMSEHLLTNHPGGEDLDCPMIFPHPPCLPPPAIPMHSQPPQSGSLSPRALAQSTMSGQSPLPCSPLLSYLTLVCLSRDLPRVRAVPGQHEGVPPHLPGARPLPRPQRHSHLGPGAE